jgi:CheY-like chemotaxis protein
MARVLIFDDDHDILQLCSLILEDKGYTTGCYTTCRDILQVVQDFSPDVILMDNWIPDEGGIKATKQLKQYPATMHIPVIIISGSNEVEDFARQANADFFLSKPFDITELESVVNAANQKKIG